MCESFIVGHLHDPIIWLRLSRTIFFIVAAIVMFWEPFVCGGVNRSFHRLLGVSFLAGAYHAHAIANARCLVLATNPSALAEVDLLLSELVVTGALLVVLFSMAVQFFKWRMMNEVTPQLERRACQSSFRP